MEKLLTPDIGLSVWTLLTFLSVVYVLSKTAWKPLIRALEEREERLQAERQAVEATRKAAEDLKEDLERELRWIEIQTREAVARAKQDGQKSRNEIIQTAQAEAQALAERTRKVLEEEKERLIRQLRAEVADLSVCAAERILKKSLDPDGQQRLLQEFFRDMEKMPRPN